MYITEWLRQRGRFGFDEWHSNSYYPICLAPLHNIYDFAIMEDAKLRQMAGAVLDYMYFNLAADSFRGVFGTTHGRSYGVNLKYPDLEGTAATCWLLFGTGALASGASGMAPVSIATSAYRLPRSSRGSRPMSRQSSSRGCGRASCPAARATRTSASTARPTTSSQACKITARGSTSRQFTWRR
jgi:hypothetical protein